MSSATVRLIGLRDMDVTFEKMLSIMKLCDESEISYPKEIETYFGDLIGEYEDYIRDEMQHVILVDFGADGFYSENVPYSRPELANNMVVAVDIKLSDIPPDIKSLRVAIDYD